MLIDRSNPERDDDLDPARRRFRLRKRWFPVYGQDVAEVELRVFRQCLALWDAPTVKRWNEGVVRHDGRYIEPLQLVCCPRGEFGDILHRYERFAADAASDSVKHAAGLSYCHYVWLHERHQTSYHTVIHELGHAALVFEPERSAESRSPHSAFFDLVRSPLREHGRTQWEKTGLQPCDARRFLRLWDRLLDEKPITDAQQAWFSDFDSTVSSSFVSAYAAIDEFRTEVPVEDRGEEFFVESLAASLIADQSSYVCREWLETIDAPLLRAVDSFMDGRDGNHSAQRRADEFVAALRDQSRRCSVSAGTALRSHSARPDAVLRYRNQRSATASVMTLDR